jgi:hypothetical protein
MECPTEAGRAPNWARFLRDHRPPWVFFAHRYFDPANRVRVCSLDSKAAHCGNGNSFRGHRSIGYEHAGYAAQARDVWLNQGGPMLQASAQAAAEDVITKRIPLRWADGRDLANGVGGFTSHHLCSLVLYGSTHTDPDPNFPIDVWMSMVAVAVAAMHGTPVPPPAPPGVVTMALELQHRDGRRERFRITDGVSPGQAPAGELQHRWQDKGPGGPFGPYLNLTPGHLWVPGSLGGLVGQDANLNVTAQRAGADTEYTMWQDEATLAWNGPFPLS